MRPMPRLRPIRLTLCAIAALSMTAALSASRADDGQWIHVRVQEKGDKAETVRVNLPVTLLESLAPALANSHFESEKLKIGDKGIDRATLKAMWESVRKTGDAEFVTMESEGETVRVARSGNDLVVKVIGSQGKSEKVDVRIPVAVVDALLSGSDNELNFAAALQALKSQGSGELVAVDDDSSIVRIWIDGKNTDR